MPLDITQAASAAKRMAEDFGINAEKHLQALKTTATDAAQQALETGKELAGEALDAGKRLADELKLKLQPKKGAIPATGEAKELKLAEPAGPLMFKGPIDFSAHGLGYNFILDPASIKLDGNRIAALQDNLENRYAYCRVTAGSEGGKPTFLISAAFDGMPLPEPPRPMAPKEMASLADRLHEQLGDWQGSEGTRDALKQLIADLWTASRG